MRARGRPDFGAQSRLCQWRREVFARDHSNSQLDPSAILDDATITSLTTVGPLSIEQITAILRETWTWWPKYGQELIVFVVALQIVYRPLPKTTAKPSTSAAPAVAVSTPAATPSTPARRMAEPSGGTGLPEHTAPSNMLETPAPKRRRLELNSPEGHPSQMIAALPPAASTPHHRGYAPQEHQTAYLGMTNSASPSTPATEQWAPNPGVHTTRPYAYAASFPAQTPHRHPVHHANNPTTLPSHPSTLHPSTQIAPHTVNPATAYGMPANGGLMYHHPPYGSPAHGPPVHPYPPYNSPVYSFPPHGAPMLYDAPVQTPVRQPPPPPGPSSLQPMYAQGPFDAPTYQYHTSVHPQEAYAPHDVSAPPAYPAPDPATSTVSRTRPWAQHSPNGSFPGSSGQFQTYPGSSQ